MRVLEASQRARAESDTRWFGSRRHESSGYPAWPCAKSRSPGRAGTLAGVGARDFTEITITGCLLGTKLLTARSFYHCGLTESSVQGQAVGPLITKPTVPYPTVVKHIITIDKSDKSSPGGNKECRHHVWCLIRGSLAEALSADTTHRHINTHAYAGPVNTRQMYQPDRASDRPTAAGRRAIRLAGGPGPRAMRNTPCSMEAFDNGFRTGPYRNVRPGPEPVIERYRGPGAQILPEFVITVFLASLATSPGHSGPILEPGRGENGTIVGVFTSSHDLTSRAHTLRRLTCLGG
ncbi:hypothetical protein Bbelb_233860 [Branchiostoma belcheri]|nr:hypothetical protein Bbelb_233860 [Branchiostoma belcheri]